MSEIPIISPKQGFIKRTSNEIVSSILYQLQTGSCPTIEILTYRGELNVPLSRTPALELSKIIGYRNGNYFEFEIGTITDPNDVYLDVAQSKLIWQQGRTPDINSNYKVWYRYQVKSSDLRASSPGSILRLLCEAFGYELNYIYDFMNEVYKSGMIDFATGLSLDYLTTIVLGNNEIYPDGTRTPRLQPTKSEGFVTFYGKPGSSITSDVRVRTDEVSPRYFVMKNPQDHVIPAGSDSITIEFISEGVGSIQNVSVGFISVIDNKESCSNITAISNNSVFSGGSDLETDDHLRERAKNAFQTYGRGTLGAIKYAVMAIPGIVNCFTSDIMTIRSIGKGYVSVIVVGENIPIAKGSELWRRIKDTVDSYKGAGIVPIISQPYLVNIDVNCSLKAHPLIFESVKSSIISAIRNYILKLDCGADVKYYELLKSTQNIEGIDDFIINYLRKTDASNFGEGGFAEKEPTMDFAKQWSNSGKYAITRFPSPEFVSVAPDEMIGQNFTPANEWLSGISFYRKGVGDSTGDWIIEVWETSVTPTAKISGSSNIIITEDEWNHSHNYQKNCFNLQFSPPIRLDTTKTYSLVIRRTNSPSGTDETIELSNDTALGRLYKYTTTWNAIDGKVLRCIFHFSGEYKIAQSFNFRTNIVTFERRQLPESKTGDLWIIQPTSFTKLPCDGNGFLGIFKARQLDDELVPDFFDLENYGERTDSSIAVDGTITLDDRYNQFSAYEEIVVSYEYYPFLENFSGVRLWLRTEELYEGNFDGQLILRIETDSSDAPSGNLICYNEVGYCFIYDANIVPDENKWRDETRDVNDSDSGDVIVEIDSGDFIYIGDDEQFKSLYIDFTIGATGSSRSFSIAYWNGSAWVSLRKIVDGTLFFGQSGLISFFPPEDWKKVIVKDVNAYWIRIGNFTNFANNPEILRIYLSFAEKILNYSELNLTSSFREIYFEFAKPIRIVPSAISNKYWITLQAVGQKTGRVILKTDNSSANYPGRSRVFDGSSWGTTTKLFHEQLTIVTEEVALVDSNNTVIVKNQSKLKPIQLPITSDCYVLDVVISGENNKDESFRSVYHKPGISGSFDENKITLVEQVDEGTEVLVSYAYDFSLSTNIHTDWIFEIVIEKLINKEGMGKMIDPNIKIENQKKLIEKALPNKIIINRIE